MLLFLDTEFTDSIDCDLISIGIFSDDGREFYGERNDFDQSSCSPFVREAVLPHLGQESALIGTEDQLGMALRSWLKQFETAGPVYVCVDHPADWDLFVGVSRDPDTLEMPAWIKCCSIRNVVKASDVERYWELHGRKAHHRATT